METYSILSKAKTYSGLSLTVGDVDWIQEYREALKAPVCGQQSHLYSDVKIFKPRYV